MTGALKRPLDGLDVVALDDVALADVLIVGERHAALLAGRHLLHLVLEALEGGERAFVDHDVVADEPDLGAALHLALGDAAARDLADLGDVEHLQDARIAQEDLADHRSQQARHGGLNVVHEIVDDVVVADLDARLVRGRLGLHVGAHVEAQHDGLGRACEHDVGLGDAADARVHHARLDLVGAELAQGADDGLDRALHVALHDQRELLAAGLLELLHHLLERAPGAGRAQRLPALARAVVGDLASARLVLHHCERIAGLRRRIEAQDLHRHRWSGRVDGLAAVVDQGAHAAPSRAGDDDVADMQAAALHQHGAHGAAPALQLGLNDHALGRAVRIGPEVEQLGLQQDGLQQLVDAGPLERRDLDLQRLARHALDDHLVLQEIGAHALRIGARLVHLVDGDDHRHLGRLGVVDRLHRLRHHAVVGGDHQNHDVRDLGAARPHGGERLVTRRVDERDGLAAGGRHLIGADMLGDAAGLALGDVGLADGVEERGLAVVDVPHDGDDGRAWQQGLVDIGGAGEAFLDVGLGHALGRMAELAHDQLGRVGVDRVVDLVHRALAHQEPDDVDGALGHAVGELLDGDHLGNNHLAHHLVPRLLDAGLTQLVALAPAPQRRKRALALGLIEGVVDGELAALAPLAWSAHRGLGDLGAFLLAARLLLRLGRLDIELALGHRFGAAHVGLGFIGGRNDDNRALHGLGFGDGGRRGLGLDRLGRRRGG